MLTEEQKALQADCVNATADYFMVLMQSSKTREQKRAELVKNMMALLAAQLDEVQKNK